MTEASQRRFIWPSLTRTWPNSSTWTKKAGSAPVTPRAWSTPIIQRVEALKISHQSTPQARCKSRLVASLPLRHRRPTLSSIAASSTPSNQSTRKIQSRPSWWRTHVGRSWRPRKFLSESKTELKRWGEPGKRPSTSPWKKLPSWFSKSAGTNPTRSATRSTCKKRARTGSSTLRSSRRSEASGESTQKITIKSLIITVSCDTLKTIERLRSTLKRSRQMRNSTHRMFSARIRCKYRSLSRSSEIKLNNSISQR